MNLIVDWCSQQAAEYAVTHWHYSRTLQAGKAARLGVWESGRFIGALVFTMGSGGTTEWAKRVGLERTEMAELARVALSKHTAPVSRIVAIAIRLLRQQSPGLRLLVSYADPRHGHHGGIYQAGGWVYVGQTAPERSYIAPDGKEHHRRTISPLGYKLHFGQASPVWKPEQCEVIQVPGKHKYLFPLDREVADRINSYRLPYPKSVKRVGSIPAETAVSHTEEDGSTPIPTLQCFR